MSPLAANSFSVPNMAAIARMPSLSQPTHTNHTYGYQTYGGLSQPDRPYGMPDQEVTPPPRSYSFTQATDYGENDLYSSPIDQLPPSATPQIITPG